VLILTRNEFSWLGKPSVISRIFSFEEGSVANFNGMGSKAYDIVFSNAALH